MPKMAYKNVLINVKQDILIDLAIYTMFGVGIGTISKDLKFLPLKP